MEGQRHAYLEGDELRRGYLEGEGRGHAYLEEDERRRGYLETDLDSPQTRGSEAGDTDDLDTELSKSEGGYDEGEGDVAEEEDEGSEGGGYAGGHGVSKTVSTAEMGYYGGDQTTTPPRLQRSNTLPSQLVSRKCYRQCTKSC